MVEDHDYKAATEFLGALERFHGEEEGFSDVYAATWLFRHWSESDYSNALFVLRGNEAAPIRGMVENYDSFLRAVMRDLDDEHGNKNALIIDKYQNAKRCYDSRRYGECLKKLEQAIELIVEGGINSLGFSHGRIDPDNGMFTSQERNHLKEWDESNRRHMSDGNAIDVNKGIRVLSWKDERFKEIDRLRKSFDSARREILLGTVPKNNIGYCVEICLKAVRDMIGIVIETRESKRLMDSSEFIFNH